MTANQQPRVFHAARELQSVLARKDLNVKRVLTSMDSLLHEIRQAELQQAPLSVPAAGARHVH